MKLSEFYKRVITSLILVPTTIFLISFTYTSFIFFLLFILFLSLYEWFNFNKDKFSYITLVGSIFILLAFFSAYLLRENNNLLPTLLLWIISVSVFTDIGGYFVGKLIGGKKVSKISPNKTYAGVYGSLIFSIMPIIILYLFDNKIAITQDYAFNFLYFYLSFFLSAVSQFGDFTVSYFKRLNNVKDTGKILPGHGGILDRIDGLIFTLIAAGFLKYFGVI